MGTHPHWVTKEGVQVTKRKFVEYVIKNEERHRVKEVHIYGGTLHEEISLPRVDVFIKKAVTFDNMLLA